MFQTKLPGAIPVFMNGARLVTIRDMYIGSPSKMFKEVLRYLLFDLWFNDINLWSWRLHSTMKFPDGLSYKGKKGTVAVPSDLIDAAYGGLLFFLINILR